MLSMFLNTFRAYLKASVT